MFFVLGRPQMVPLPQYLSMAHALKKKLFTPLSAHQQAWQEEQLADGAYRLI